MFQISQIIQPAEGIGEDRLVVVQLGLKVVIAIADGAGGRSGGAEAADLVALLVKERAESLNSQANCESILAELDSMIVSDTVAGETTAIVSVASADGIWGASVGDSGAWLVGAIGVDELTEHQVRKPFLGTGGAMPVGFSRANGDGTLLVSRVKQTRTESVVSKAGQSGWIGC